ncbi:hypothetical protein BD410DRAFT_781699 [Rickenella mellea]|uniref:Uncharacterized protein n=1 Tax=Rickenella mellea TaxID=50990 RepID=A0A4Y7QL43_9AGAM|nr:hypothetical protein BD410DRAFT_781699 [Rickenella mellea]
MIVIDLTVDDTDDDAEAEDLDRRGCKRQRVHCTVEKPEPSAAHSEVMEKKRTVKTESLASPQRHSNSAERNGAANKYRKGMLAMEDDGEPASSTALVSSSDPLAKTYEEMRRSDSPCAWRTPVFMRTPIGHASRVVSPQKPLNSKRKPSAGSRMTCPPKTIETRTPIGHRYRDVNVQNTPMDKTHAKAKGHASISIVPQTPLSSVPALAQKRCKRTQHL